MDIDDFNRRWLAAWTAKDIPALLGFYAEDCLYQDNNTAAGITGHAALEAYLQGLFAATPPMTYAPDAVWPIE
ncbi:MAG TPA: nuclear transport factor 2 family protein, partial [Caulobacter sp.]|nr:nuclear transport factor 2 family protein [Caulobacter sp.]